MPRPALLPHLLRLVLLGALLGAPLSAAAPAAATGTVAGRVLNVGTGQYLNNARVAVRGTSNAAFTDKDGSYRLAELPAGPATLEVFFTGLDPATAQVLVPAGGAVQQDFNLTSVARYGQQGDATVRLDAFVVAQQRETDAQAIATNEQRFAPNIKNVLSTDALGDVLGGSVGEFMKFLPGVTVESDLADVSGVSIRGIGGGMTAITNDGAPASNIWTTATRSVDVRSMALNDIARMEVSKVPTPANPADSLAGSINLVSKSAFERSGRQLRYSLNLIGNHENLDLRKTPHSHGDKLGYKIFPGASLDFTWPVTKRFGIVLAANHSRSFNEQHRTLQTWTAIVAPGSPTGTPVNYANPVLNSLAFLDGPRDLTRNTLSVKADWKVGDNGVLSVGHVASRTDTRIGSLTYTWTTSTTATPSIAGGRPLAGTRLRFRQQELSLRVGTHWNAAGEWKAAVTAGAGRLRDGASGFFDHDQRHVRTELSWRPGDWRLLLEAETRRTDYLLQTVGAGITPPPRIADGHASRLRVERALGGRWGTFGEFSWERVRSNEREFSYRALGALGGVQREF